MTTIIQEDRLSNSGEQAKLFKENLKKESKSLYDLVSSGGIKNPQRSIGLELETCLTNDECSPVAENQQFLTGLAHPNVGPELSAFNIELNSAVVNLNRNGLGDLSNSLTSLWSEVQTHAKSLSRKVLMVGSLPTLKVEDLSTENMSDGYRYRLLNEKVLEMRSKKPLSLDIAGEDRLLIQSKSIMPEAGATSLQIHYCPPLEHLETFFNASMAISAPMAALCANAPLLFGKRLWHDSRIPLFEQAVSLPSFPNGSGETINRVTFGSGYLRRSIFEIYLENLDGYPILLPQLSDFPQVPFGHIHIQNGTIWRWNRPILGFNPDKSIHIRLEHRVPSAGPSIVDIMANTAFFCGLLYSMALDKENLLSFVSFKQARENFYEAARFGLDANIMWRNRKCRMVDILLSELIARAQKGLVAQGVDEPLADYFIDEIIRERVTKKATGSVWQRAAYDKYGGDLNELVKSYFYWQEQNIPVSKWTL